GVKEQSRWRAKIRAGGARIGAKNLLLDPINSSLPSLRQG
nr:hypothetical protein [Tanacetum cinerariifolium]